jgi:hypothetical protein
MIEIGNTIVSLDLVTENFTCDLSACHGACCVTGDSGAPLEPGEVDMLNEIYPLIRPYLNEKSINTIEKLGTSVIDFEKDTVTPLNDGKECAYIIFENEIARCAIEKAFHDGVISFRKPVSCYLYPVRIKKFTRFEAVNYDRWEICHQAIVRGNQLQMPVYCYVKDALINRYGKEWYNQLSEAAQHLDI